MMGQLSNHLRLLVLLGFAIALLSLSNFASSPFKENPDFRLPRYSWMNWSLLSNQLDSVCGKFCEGPSGRTVIPWNKTDNVIFGENRCTIRVPKNKYFPSVIKTDCDGRLGNQLSVYATAWYFSQNYGMQPKFLEVQIARIGAVFRRSKLEMDAVCELEENVTKRWEPLFEYNHDRYFFYNRFRRNPEEFLSNRLLDIGRYTNALYFYKENLPELRRQFQFKDNILEAAQDALRDRRRLQNG